MNRLTIAMLLLIPGMLCAQNEALSLDGTTDYMDVPHDAALNLSGSMTVEAWIKINSYPTHPAEIVNKRRRYPWQGFVLHLQNGAVEFGAFLGLTTPTYVVATASWNSVLLGQWNHVAGTIDSQVVNLYVNGALVASSPVTTPGLVGSNSNPLRMGWDSGAPTYNPSSEFEGLIDEVRYWSVARSQAEIQLAMCQQLDGQPGLVGSWHFNGNTLDTTGGHNGVLQGNAQLVSSGLTAVPGSPCPTQPCTPSTCLTFDGVDDWVQIPDHSAIEGFQDFTIEFWIRQTSSASSQCVHKWTDWSGTLTDDCYVFETNWIWPNPSPGILEATIVSGGSELKLHTATALNDGQWHHIALSRTAGAVALHVDGATESTGTFAGTINSNSMPLKLGKTFAGNLDEIRCWNVYRTQAEILASMNQGLVGNEAGLVGYWRLDDGVGQVVADSSPTANHGTLGATSAVASDDPVWSSTGPTICSLPGTGQPNSAAARLEINGAGIGVAPGPFMAVAQSGGTLSLYWEGPPGMPLTLVAGPLNLTGFIIPAVGSIDIGTPPTFSDLMFLFSGASPPYNIFFTTNALGVAQQSFSVPALPSGPVIDVQGVIPQPAGGLVLTAAFRIYIL